MSTPLLTDTLQNAEALSEAYISLINQIPGFENSVSAFFELSDGIIFSKLLNSLDKISFKIIEAGDGNWITTKANLNKLHTFMNKYIENHSGNAQLSPPDFLAIAKKQDLKELVKFCQQIFYMLFFFSDLCPSLKLAETPGLLSVEHQNLIARACNEITSHEVQNSSRRVSSASSSHEPTSNALFRQTEALNSKLEKEIEILKRDYNHVVEENKINRNLLEESQLEKQSLLQKLRKAEENSQLAGDFSKTEMLLKQEIDELRDSLSKAEEKRQEAEYTISRQNADLANLEKQNHTLREKCDQIDQLEAKNRELRHANDRFQRAENTTVKFKQRLEEFAEVKNKLKASEEQNFKLVSKISKLEEEIEKLSGSKQLAESYKEQILKLESKITTTTIEKERSQIEIRRLNETISILRIERDRYQEDAMNSEAKLRDIELGNNYTEEFEFSSAMTLDEAQTDELKAKIIKLEQELSGLRKGNRESGASQRIVILESMLEDSKKSRAKVQEELLVAHRKNIMLEEELKRFQSTEPGDQLSYDLSLNLRERLSATEEELSQCKLKLTEAEANLEACTKRLKVAESDLSMVGKDRLDGIELAKQESAKVAEKFSQENQATLKRLQELEDDGRKQMQQINQLLMDKDSLRTQSLQQKDMLLENEKIIGELKTTLVALENKGSLGSKDELSETKVLLAKETNRCMELREENIKLKGAEETLQLKIKLLNDQIKAMDKVVQNRSQGQGQELLSEALSSLKSELRFKEQELIKVKDQLKDVLKQHRRETALMTSAWHELGLRSQKEMASGNSKHAPASWLASQRSNLNVQLKRR